MIQIQLDTIRASAKDRGLQMVRTPVGYAHGALRNSSRAENHGLLAEVECQFRGKQHGKFYSNG